MRKLICALVVILTLLLLTGQAFAQEGNTLDLKYDDRKTLAALGITGEGEVAISNEVVTSKQVGTETPDAHVLVYEDGTLYAVGTGTATLTVGDTAYAVKVEPAVLSLIMYTGHSVGHGAEGNAYQSVVVEAGQAYSIYDPRYIQFGEVDGYGLGWGSEKRVSNRDVGVSSGGTNHIDALAPGKGGIRGAGAALAWQWNALTGEKLWVLNTAVGGSCLNEWMPDAGWHSPYYSDYYNTAVKTYTYAQSIIKNEIAAGHYTLGHMGLLYYCGANDKYYPAWNLEKVEADYEALWNNFHTAFSTDMDGDGKVDELEFMGLVPYWTPSWRSKFNFDKGAAQYMASSPEYPHMFMASNMIREFMWDENLNKFPAINYTTQSKDVSAPTKVKYAEGESCVMGSDNAHPSQVGYNAIGIDTANNLYAWLNGADTTITEITLYDENFGALSDGLTIKVGEPFQIAPWFEPFYADDLSYAVSGNAKIVYPLQLEGTAPGTATLTVSQKGQVIKTLTVNVEAGHGTHCACGGTLTGTAAQKHGTCSNDEKWIPLDTKWIRWHEYEKSADTNDFMKVLTGGSYYLEDDLTWDGLIAVAPGETVNICLNGHKLTTSSRSFEVQGTLNICDCQGGGQVYSNYANEAPVAYVRRGGTWNIYGGSYSAVAPNNRDYAGIACVSSEVLFCNYDAPEVGGCINLYGGILNGCALKSSDNKAGAGGAGGCIMVRSPQSKFCMYGGTLSGGKSLSGDATITQGTIYGGGSIGSAGIVELWGGTIEGTTDALGAIYGWGGTVTLKGDVTFRNNAVADIYVTNGKPLYIEAAQSGTVKVAVKTPSATDVAVVVSKALSNCVAVEQDYNALWQNGGLYITTDKHLNHCVCGGTLTGTAAQQHGSCSTITDWKALNTKYKKDYQYQKSATATATMPVLAGGNYYLEDDITWNRCIYVAPGETVTICLNGHKLTTPASVRSFSVSGTLNICDCKGGGEVYSQFEKSAPIALIGRNGHWNIYGGSYRAIAPNGREYGGVASLEDNQLSCDYNVSNGGNTIALYDGILYGSELNCTDNQAEAAGNGGCINLRVAPSAFYMYGGTLSGGKSLQGVSGVKGADYGGGIIGSIGTVELWGGRITGSTDPIGAISGRSGKVTLKGNVTFQNNAVADIYVTDGKPLYIEAAQSGTVKVAVKTPSATNAAVVADYDKVGCIKTDANHTALYQDGKVYIVNNADLANLHAHCYCGGKAANVGDHVCTTMPILYTAWTDSTKLPTSGTYYLDTSITTSTRCDITSATLRLCLNGQSVTSNNRVFNLKGAVVDMCDCATKEGSITSSNGGAQALITTNIVGVTTGSEFNLYSGKLIHTGNVPDADGIDEAPIQIKGYVKTGEGAYTAQGIMRMYGGTVQGGTVNATGATINVQSSSATMGGRFYMYGGNLIGGNAVNGGALSLVSRDSQAFIYGGTISGGVASGKGNNVYVELGKLYVYGGNIGDIALDPVDATKRDVELYVENATVANMYVADSTTAFDPVVTLAGKTVVNSLTRGGADKKPVIAFALTEGASVTFSGETDGETFGTGSSASYIYADGLRPVLDGTSLKWVAKMPSDPALRFASASVSIYADLAVNFKVDNTCLSANYTDAYVVFEFCGKTTEVSAYRVKDGMAVFCFRDIAPHLMGEPITATLYATKDGQLYKGQSRQYSITSYCYNMLNRYTDAQYAELHTLLVDLLNYGAAAQLYVDNSLQASELVTHILTDEQKTWGTPADQALGLENIRAEDDFADPSVTWVGGGLSLKESVALRLRFRAEDITGLTVVFEMDGKTYEVSEFVATDTAGEYYVFLRNMNASHMRTEVKATVYQNGQQISKILTYSVASYAETNYNDSNTYLAELVKAIIRYGDAAYAYVN